MAANLSLFTLGLVYYLTIATDAVPLVANEVPTRPNITSLTKALACTNEVSGLGFQPAASCKNGRGMIGCCIERVHCDFNTSNIDLTLYGPRGYKDSCDSKYVCCPIQYALPLIVENDAPSYDSDFIDEDK